MSNPKFDEMFAELQCKDLQGKLIEVLASYQNKVYTLREDYLERRGTPRDNQHVTFERLPINSN